MLSFCDLAGSERISKTQNVGDRQKEAGNINTSLLVLGRWVTESLLGSRLTRLVLQVYQVYQAQPGAQGGEQELAGAVILLVLLLSLPGGALPRVQADKIVQEFLHRVGSEQSDSLYLSGQLATAPAAVLG